MNMLQRMFNKKIKGKELENLFEALGGNDSFPKKWLNHDGPYVSGKSYGKLEIQPSKEGLNIELKVFLTEKNYYYGPNERQPIIIGSPKVTKGIFQIKKTIPYSELQKLNIATK